MTKTLFELVVEPSKLHPDFEALLPQPSHPARLMLDDIYQDFPDPDGNFLEQFQTAGFNARFFELYLFAYFSRSDFSIQRPSPNPDFIVSRSGISVAVEATTVNPSTSGVIGSLGKSIEEMSEDELREYERHELPIRFGSALYSKLQKRYWETAGCEGLPFVIAIEPFHDEWSLRLSDSALTGYLYGFEHFASWTPEAALEIVSAELGSHEIGPKVIPSNFFAQPGTENISAVLFTNSGTHGKFSRMGFQTGYGADEWEIRRSGTAWNPEPDARDPSWFSYSMDVSPYVEHWGEGIVVLHNPKCLHPVPRDFFLGSVQSYIENGTFHSEIRGGWHVFASLTQLFHLGQVKKKMPPTLRQRRIMIKAIPRQEFRDACGFYIDASNPLVDEQGWFSDETGSFLGVVFRERIDDEWAYVILARDPHFAFRAIYSGVSLSTRDSARDSLYERMLEFLDEPQRIFIQDSAK